MMTHNEIVEALMRQYGIDRDRAEKIATIQRISPKDAPSSSAITVRREEITGRVPLTLVHPGALTFTLPWSCLVADNRRTHPVIRNIHGAQKAIMTLTDAYSEARKKIQEIARDAMAGREPFTISLSLHAQVWVPDNRRHDTSNFAKGVHDALETVVYDNDDRLSKTVWEKMGVDVDRPRAELTIAPYAGF